MSLRILLVITSLGVGGAERLVTALADQYVALGHEVMLVRFHGDPELKPRDDRVKLYNLGMRRTPLSVVAALWRLRQILISFRPDVVNTHLFHPNILVRLIRTVSPIPRLISSAHNTYEQGLLRMLTYRLTDRLAELSTNVSEEAVEAFESQGAVKPGRMLALHNGIDAERFIFDPVGRMEVRRQLRLPEHTPLILAVGRLWEQKDYPNLLHAFLKVVSSDASPRLAIAGDGPLRHDLEKMVANLGLEGRVTFLGVRHDIQKLLSACDIYVMSSAWEGLPMVILEAMATQRCIVATDCGGVRSLLNDTGFIVRTGDSEALGETIQHALSLSEEGREEVGAAAGKRVVEHYSLQATAERYLTLYCGNDLISKA